jgi:hypothetical protein
VKNKIKKLFLFLLLFTLFSISPCSERINAPTVNFISINSNTLQKVFSDNLTIINIHLFCLKDTLQKMIQIDDYKVIYKNGKFYRSFCNVASRDALDNRDHSTWGRHYGFYLDDISLDISNVFPTAFSILRYSIHEAYIKVMQGIKNGKIESVNAKEAYELAKVGEVVWVISDKYNHEGIIYPDQRRWIPERGCRFAQCGKYNTIRDISHKYCFGKWWKDPEIKYIHFYWRNK